MQIDAWLFESIMLIIIAIGVGTFASMIGIGGGVINTPMLIIVFGIVARFAPAASLLAALFVAIASTIAYHHQEPRPIINKVGLFLAITSIPGSWTGIWLRNLIADDFILRLLFGFLLFPLALKMLYAKKKSKTDYASEIAGFNLSQVPRSRLTITLVGAFGGGITSGLLGLGGGSIIVPVLCVILGLPMHAAVATSMFTMIFTASSGTVMNYFVLLEFGEVERIMIYGIILGIGMVVGGQLGPMLACRINAVQLKQIFGLILIYPIVRMMKLGQIWLDPMNQSPLMSTIGDLTIWLALIIPVGLLRYYYLIQHRKEINGFSDECELPEPG